MKIYRTFSVFDVLFVFLVIIMVIPHIGFEGNCGKTGYLNDWYSFLRDVVVPQHGQVVVVKLTSLCQLV